MIRDLITDRRYRQRKWVLALIWSAATITGLFTDQLDAVAFNSAMAIILAGYGFMAWAGTSLDREEKA